MKTIKRTKTAAARIAVKTAAKIPRRTTKATAITTAETTTNGDKKEGSTRTCPYETGFGRI